jgi:hypothetical protein
VQGAERWLRQFGRVQTFSWFTQCLTEMVRGCPKSCHIGQPASGGVRKPSGRELARERPASPGNAVAKQWRDVAAGSGHKNLRSVGCSRFSGSRNREARRESRQRLRVGASREAVIGRRVGPCPIARPRESAPACPNHPSLTAGANRGRLRGGPSAPGWLQGELSPAPTWLPAMSGL